MTSSRFVIAIALCCLCLQTVSLYSYAPPAQDSTPLRPIPPVQHDFSGSKFGPQTYGLPQGLDILRSIDSTASKVDIREKINGVEVAVPVTMSLDDYLALRRRQISQHIWDSLVTVYDLKRAMSGDQLAKLLSQATNVAIPIPPNPLTGIFGKPEISINVNGEITLRGGWRWESQNLGTSSVFGQNQSSPIFTQDIQINVSAKIGDKLKLGTDWSTRRQFEFDNKFKIGYDGYDDDIIKKVEVGNVQLQSPSSFINGSQALFGIRADFQFGPLFLKTIASQKRGERKIISVNSGASRTAFALHAYDYAQNHFFLDTVYKPLYRQYWQSSIPTTVNSGSLLLKSVEVYESTADTKEQATSGVSVVAYDTLSPIIYNQKQRYPAAMKNPTIIESGKVMKGRFVKLDPSRYEWDQTLGTVSIINMRRDRSYAVAYVMQGAAPTVDDDQYVGTGSLITNANDTAILKLIYVPNLQPGFKNLWARQMRNIYFINATNVNTTDAKIDIYYLRTNNDSTNVLEGTSDKIVTALRVDQVNNGNGQAPGDGVFDFSSNAGTAQPSQPTYSNIPGATPTNYSGSPFFNARNGEIIFPCLEPFREGLDTAFARHGQLSVAKQYYYASVYDNQVELAKQQTAYDRWLIVGNVQGQNNGRITLGFNVAPGSVVVRLDGRQLKENDDYTVEYVSGVLTLRNPQAAAAGANLTVEYESNDIMNVTTKTLAGVRADMALYRNRWFTANAGGTYMYYNQAAVIDRVRVGEEPVANEMLGFDLGIQWKADWLTRALNSLPFFNTKEQSLINLKGEWAMQMPNPNKRLSEIPADENAPVAYIDDFESAQRDIPLGLSPLQWTYCSPPEDSTIAADPTARALYRSKIQWWQYFIGRIPQSDPYPKRSIRPGYTNLSALYINFYPETRGIYNMNPDFIDELNPRWDSVSGHPWQHDVANRPKLWGGFQRLLSSFNSNFDLENIDYIEIMMKVDSMEFGKTQMYIDLGQVSEDVIPNQTLNTEDGITAAAPQPNNRIDPGEDVGIDEWDDNKEKLNVPYPLNLESDPSRDNFNFDFNKNDGNRGESDFDKYNNYEGNASQSESGQFPDTEVLNKQNGQNIALDNSYFEYQVNLDPAENNPQVVGGGVNGWRLYRIPLRGNKTVIGNPLFSNIQYLRVWFKGGPLKAEIVDWRFAGSQWQRVNYAAIENSANITDNTLRVSFANLEENDGPPDYYTMPPGVQAPRQLANPDPQNDILLNEQSISIGVDNLACGDERAATRYFRSFDIFNYKKLRFFVKGIGGQDYIPPDTNSITSADTSLPQYFIRFGTDSANYYEYRAPLVRDWIGVNIDLAQLTAIKQQRDSISQYSRLTFPVPGQSTARYAVQGNPTLTRVQYFALGLANPVGRCPASLSTTMWVDELRVIDPERSTGYAETGSADIKFADLGTFNASYIHTDPYFHRLEERFGSRENSRTFSMAVDAGFEKFLPRSMKEARIPVHFARITRAVDPLFMPQNDVNVDAAAALVYKQKLDSGKTTDEAQAASDYIRRRSQTRTEQTNFSIMGFKFGLPSNAWYVRETINKLVMGFSYTQEAEQSPVVEERFRWQWDFSANYAVSLPPLLSFKTGGWMTDRPLLSAYKDWKLNLLPQTVTLSTKISRSRQTEQSWFIDYPNSPVRLFNATNSMVLGWKLSEGGFLSPALDYSVTSGSTLVPLELDSLGHQLTGSEVAKKMLFSESRLVNFGTPNNLSQNFVLNFRPRLPEIGNINRYFDASGSFSTNFIWVDPLQNDPTLRDVSKRASYANSIRVNSSLRLRTMTNSWFGIQPPIPGAKVDTSKHSSILDEAVDLVRSIFFDYESLNINFNQNNTAVTPGVFGGNGFSNLWARGFTGRASEEFLGPSAAYQLGLVRYPHGSFHITGSSKFPFFGFEEDPGVRPPNAQLLDNFMQNNSLDLRTSRPLWKGATLDLSWKSEFGQNRNQLTTTDANGNMSYSNVIITERYNRTFLTLPNFFIFKALNNSPSAVVDRYRAAVAPILNGRSPDSLSIPEKVAMQNAMTDAFIGGLQAFEFLPGVLTRYLPQVNWALHWDGIEKYFFFGGIAQKVSLEHAYQTFYTESAHSDDNGRTVDAQTIKMDFRPLVGINMAFDEKKLKGTLTGTFRYNLTTSYSLVTSAATMSKENVHEFNINAGYAIHGFSFPLLGIELKNDVEFSFNTTFQRRNRSTYQLADPDPVKAAAGSDLDGSTMIMLEPRARYTVSNRLTATAFVKYTGNFTSGAANPGYSTTEVGVEVRLAVSGGR